MTDRQLLLIARAGVACAVLLSLWLRVAPAWHFVFTSPGVDFQDSDAWFHVRTAHNLLAHFPFRSGFDPYALFPSGMNMPTGPLWDYMIASAAWIAGLGSPSSDLIDRVAAWLPAILGALCPIPIFWVTRQLFGLTAGLFAALWIAVTHGEFLWLTHLGNTDHHAAEGFFTILVFCFLCVATEGSAGADGRNAAWNVRWLPALAGVSLGALLATQPAAIFVPGMLVAATLLAPSIAREVLYVFGAAMVVMLPVGENPYSTYDWLSLAAGTGIVAAIWLLHLLHLRRSHNAWLRWARWILVSAAFVLALGVAAMTRPALIRGAWSSLRSLTDTSTDVSEMEPVIRAGTSISQKIDDMTRHLGAIWVPALPGLVWIVIFALRRRRPSLTLLALFSVTFTIAGFMHLRLILYYIPFAAILAGAICAWLARFATSFRYRLPLASVLAGALLALNIQPSIAQMTTLNNGIGRDWFATLNWLRLNTPEPFGNGDLWNGYFPRSKTGQASSPAAPAWGIATFWDHGYIVEDISRRIPLANGFGAGITAQQDAQNRIQDMARFYSGTFPETAVNLLRKLGARYAIVDPSMPLIPEIAQRSELPTIQKDAGYDWTHYYRVLWRASVAGPEQVFVYFPDYYRIMAVRLFLYDGKAVKGSGPWVIGTVADSLKREVITSGVHFDSERAAGDYLAAHADSNLMIGCLQPFVSCFDVDAVKGLHRVFTSDPAPITGNDVHTVKVFEVEPAPPVGSK